MKLNIQAHREVESGYGRFGYFTVRALENLGVENCGDLGLEPQTFADKSTCQRSDTTQTELAHVALWLSTPPHVHGYYEGQFPAIFTMWESTEIPEGFRHNLHHFERIFVPSVQNKEIYSVYHKDVRVIPLGVDGKWGFRRRPTINRDFVFLTAGYGTRKGCPQVAAAFLKVFPNGMGPRGGPIPKLICKTQDDIHGPGITVINKKLDGPAERNLYATAHCYVSGSKGEGWGLMPLQAIAQGCPTILGDAHGHHAFAHLGTGLDTHPYKCPGATFWGDGGEWWEPDFDQMCEAMWDVYNDYAHYEGRAVEASLTALTEFSWDKTAEGIILGLGDQLFEPAPTERVWHTASAKVFFMRVNQTCTFTINGIDNHFEPGVDYWESADLKRSVIAAGKLDMATFDPHDMGLEDNEALQRIRAHNSVCQTCHQPYNRDQTLKELFA